MYRFLLICLGGAIGTGARYLIALEVPGILGTGFPYATLTVNVVGSFLLGAIMHIGLTTNLMSPELRLMLTTGIMGGFTMYSTFNYETIEYLREGAFPARRTQCGSHAPCFASRQGRSWSGLRLVGRGELILRVLAGEQRTAPYFIGESDRLKGRPLADNSR